MANVLVLIKSPTMALADPIFGGALREAWDSVEGGQVFKAPSPPVQLEAGFGDGAVMVPWVR